MDVSGNTGFGSRLRLLRQGRSMSQSQLARAIGRHQTAVGPYERGEYMPARDVIEKIARVLETSPEYLLFGRSPYRSAIDVADQTGPHGIIAQASENLGKSPIAIDESRILAIAVTDQSMQPALWPGDYALIERQEAQATDALFSQVVLAELDDGRQLIRQMLPGSRLDCVDLVAFNGPVWQNVMIKRAQKLVGCLRPDALDTSS